MGLRRPPVRSYRQESGFSLVEVLIAMGLVGTVILSVVALFLMGRRNIYSGKQMTHAVAMGTHVMEDLSGMSGDDIYDAFNIGGTSSLGSYTLDGVAYSNVLLRSTSGTIVTGPPSDLLSEKDPDASGPALGFLTTWKNELTSDNKMQNSSVTLVISPRSPTAVMTGGTPDRPAPGFLHVKAIVRWNESLRVRSVMIDTVKARRGF